MKCKKTLVIVFLFFCLLICISQASANDSNLQSNELHDFKIDFVYPMDIDEFITLLKDNDEVYDNKDTIKWLEELDDCVVFYSGNNYLLMEKADSEAIYNNDADEAIIDDGSTITCTIMETHKTSSYMDDSAYLVKNIKVKGESFNNSGIEKKGVEFKIYDDKPNSIKYEISEQRDYYDYLNDYSSEITEEESDEEDNNWLSNIFSWGDSSDENPEEYDSLSEEDKEKEKISKTIDWLNEYDGYVVFSTDDGNHLIMNKTDAQNIPEPTDEIGFNTIKCDVIKTKYGAYGNYKLVNNVELIKQENEEIEEEIPEDDEINIDSQDSDSTEYYSSYTDSSSISSSSDSDSSSSHSSYIGNSNTGKFHRTYCSDVKKISPGNKVSLSSRDEAINRGFSPCGHCHP